MVVAVGRYDKFVAKRWHMIEVKCNCALCGEVIVVRFLVEPIDEEKEGFYCDPCAKKVDPDFEPIEDD